MFTCKNFKIKNACISLDKSVKEILSIIYSQVWTWTTCWSHLRLVDAMKSFLFSVQRTTKTLVLGAVLGEKLTFQRVFINTYVMDVRGNTGVRQQQEFVDQTFRTLTLYKLYRGSVAVKRRGWMWGRYIPRPAHTV